MPLIVAIEAPKSTGLSEPWSGMGLPIGDGSLLYSDGQSMTLSYGGYSAPLHARDFDEALLAAGWTSTFQSDDGGMFSHVYSHNSETLTLSVVEAAGRTTLSITRY